MLLSRLSFYSYRSLIAMSVMTVRSLKREGRLKCSILLAATGVPNVRQAACICKILIYSSVFLRPVKTNPYIGAKDYAD